MPTLAVNHSFLRLVTSYQVPSLVVPTTVGQCLETVHREHCPESPDTMVRLSWSRCSPASGMRWSYLTRRLQRDSDSTPRTSHTSVHCLGMVSLHLSSWQPLQFLHKTLPSPWTTFAPNSSASKTSSGLAAVVYQLPESSTHYDSHPTPCPPG